MNILIVGCGKVGSRLAGVLSREGHDVSIVDREEANFALLPDDFGGVQTLGIPIDQDVLRRAGIESCDALAAVSADDNVNIMVSELAREIFHVPAVVARIYDPSREDVFSHFGLQTVCPTNLTVDAVESALVEPGETRVLNLGSHTLSFTTHALPERWLGSPAADYPLAEGQSLFAVVHEDQEFELWRGQKLRFRAGDQLVIANLVD